MANGDDTVRHNLLGLDGGFVRARDLAALVVWYREHLSFDVRDLGGAFGALFKFADRNRANHSHRPQDGAL